MNNTASWRGLRTSGVTWVGLAALVVASVSAGAQSLLPPKPKDPNQVQVYLVRQDFSDCTNSNVPNVDSPLVGGNVWVTREQNGTTAVKVALTASPNTAYHFFLKCVREVATIHTDTEGVANVSFTFPTNSAGSVFAFDSYPDGAPAGNKFQSAQVDFR